MAGQSRTLIPARLPEGRLRRRRRAPGSPFGGGADARGCTRAASSSAGKTIRVLVVGDPFQFALDEIKDQFTAQTGINIEYGEPGLRPAQRAVGDEFRQRHP